VRKTKIKKKKKYLSQCIFVFTVYFNLFKLICFSVSFSGISSLDSHGRYGKFVGVISDDQIELMSLCEKFSVYGDSSVSYDMTESQRLIRFCCVKTA